MSQKIQKKIEQLEERYERLTSRIGKELQEFANTEANINYQQLQDEREIVSKQIKHLKDMVTVKEHTEKNHHDNKGLEVSEGSLVYLENRTHSLRFRLVESVYSFDEEQISINSPIGKAVLGHRVGEEIEVSTPKGKIHYKIRETE
jgi:transcription elongation factor GreA